MKPTLKMLLDLCHDDTKQAFIQYCENNEISLATPGDLEEFARILEQARCALVNLGGSNALGDVAEDVESAIAQFVSWPKSNV
jgi:hypothetical protein